MKKSINFLQKHPDVAFATVGQDGRPKIRVFQIMQFIEDKLYFATSPRKEVYGQLQKNPFVELLGMEGDISVRISGKVDFQVTDEIAQLIYNKSEILQRIYKDYKELAYFNMEIEKMDYYDLSVNPPLLESYTGCVEK